ncbi:MAG: ribose 5-phosphate isomerase B [Deltaproteobacteria bacterium]|nr:ribose 5-phosphate isomerase B [Deltaproteobacteria bacterium]
MRIVIGSDHAGFSLKQDIAAYLEGLGHKVLDLGPHNVDPVDFPDYAEAVGLAIQRGQAERGILICGSGVGVSVAANKMPGIRAAPCHDIYSAHQSVEHDDVNVLALGAQIIGPAVAHELVQAFLGASFSGKENHRRRVEKIKAMEVRYAGQAENHPPKEGEKS